MKKIVNHEKIGEILYDESIWSGSATICINGIKLEKTGKKEYRLPSGSTALLTGNFITGVKLNVDGEVVVVSRAASWYEIAISVAFFVLIMIWGNNASLCAILPVIGGAVGGALGGGFASLGLAISATMVKPWQKILSVVGAGVAAFLLCLLLGLFVTGFFL